MLQTEHQDIYPRLLLRGYCLLAFFSGLVAVRLVYPGIVGLCLLLLLGCVQGKRFVHGLFFCLCFGLGVWLGFFRAPAPPPEPAWLSICMGGEDTYARPQTVYVEGLVDAVDIFADGRVRLLVQDIHPVAPPPALHEYYANLPESLTTALAAENPYEGRVSVTLWDAEEVPLPGQSIRFSGRFAKVRSFANPGVFGIDAYWHDKGVWIRGWNVRGSHSADVLIKGTPRYWAKIRHGLWADFVSSLPAMRMMTKDRYSLKEAHIHPKDLQLIQGTGQAFLPALVFGDRSGITPYQKELLSKATLTHSIALSGLHLAYFGFVGLGLALLVGKFFPSFLLHMPRGRLCFVITVPLGLIYLWVGGAPLSLIRSATMLFFFGLALFSHQTQVLLDRLLLAVFLIVLVSPTALFDLGLQLSALSVGVIALLYPLITRCAHWLIPLSPLCPFRQVAQGRLRAGISLLGMSLCIQLVLSPLLIHVFGMVGLWFPLNLLWLPILGATVMPLVFFAFFCVCCGWSWLAGMALSLASLPCEGLMALLQWMDTAGYLVAPLTMRPHWLATVGIWLCLGLSPPVLWRWWLLSKGQRPMDASFRMTLAGWVGGFVLVAGFTAWGYYDYFRQDVSLALLDVGQGQSVVLSWPGGRALVDGGGFPSQTFDVGSMVVSPYLTATKPARIDWLINTHPDYDHLGGMLRIFDGFSVRYGFAHNGDRMRESLEARYARIAENKKSVAQEIWRAGDYIALAPEVGLEVLWPPKGRAPSEYPRTMEEIAYASADFQWPSNKGVHDESKGMRKAGAPTAQTKDGEVVYTGNDASLVLRFVWQGKGLALLCGDIGHKALKEMLATTAPECLQAEVLVLPHHGSRNSFSKALYTAVNPEKVLVSCSYKNVWGFPNKHIVNTLKDMGKPLYSTAEYGLMRVVWEGGQEKGSLELTR